MRLMIARRSRGHREVATGTCQLRLEVLAETNQSKPMTIQTTAVGVAFPGVSLVCKTRLTCVLQRGENCSRVSRHWLWHQGV
jgi:hypothetical protein